MLALKHSRVLVRSNISSRSIIRAYSSHSNEKHDEHSEHGEHGEHDDHSMPLAESDSIINNKTGTALGIVALIVGYSYINSNYASNNEGTALSSLATCSKCYLNNLKENYSAYRERVKKQSEIQEMMMFPAEKRTYNNFITSVDTVPGQRFATGSNTQFNTIQDFDSLAPRKQKESPFY